MNNKTNLKKILLIFILMCISVSLFLSCGRDSNTPEDNKGSDEKQNNEENESIFKDKKDIVVNRFDIIRNGSKVGLYTSEIDKRYSVWKVSEKTLFNSKLYKSSDFKFNSNTGIITEMTIETYTEKTEDKVAIKRDNKEHEYNITYSQKIISGDGESGEDVSNTFVDTENTYIINNNLFGAYEIAFQMLMPIEESIIIRSLVPVLNNILEMEIVRKAEDKININGNIINTIRFETIRAGSRQQVWVDKNNYKIVKIDVDNGSVEVRRRYENDEDMYSAKESNTIAGEKDFDALEHDDSSSEENDADDETSEIKEIEMIDEDNENTNEDDNKELYFDENSKLYEFITSNETLFGYNQYTIIDSKNFIQIAEQTQFKLAKGPGVEDSYYQLSYMWNKNKDRIMSFNAMNNVSGNEIFYAVSERDDGLYAVKDDGSDRGEVHIRESERESLYFIMPYAVGTLELFFKSLDYDKRIRGNYDVFYPESENKSRLKIIKSEIMRGGKVDTPFPQILIESILDGVKYLIYLNEENKSVYKIYIPSKDIIIRRSNQNSADKLPELHAKSVLKKQYIEPTGPKLGSVTKSDHDNYTFIGAEILIKGKSPYEQAIQYYLDNRLQSFDGMTDKNKIKGLIEVRAVDNTIFPAIEYPIKDLPDKLSQYTESQKDTIVNIPQDNENINKIADMLASNKDNVFDVAKAVGDWIHTNIEYTISGGDAVLTFNNKKGNSGSMSQLMITMLRHLGIPVRVVGGLLYDDIYDSNFGQHYWVEVWIGDKGGWVMLDPVTGEFNSIGALRISLWRWENLMPDDETYIDIALIDRKEDE